MKRFCLAVFVAALLSGCQWFERDLEWKQEVRLQDGRTVMVDRVSKVTGKRFPEGGNYDIYQSLTFTHPDTHTRISWAPPEHTGPVMLDVDGPKAYYVVEAISVGDYNRIGCPNPPYLVYRYADKQWTQISIDDMPMRFVERNVQRRSMENKAAIADNLVTLDEYHARMYDWRVRKENREISRRRVNPIAEGCREGTLMNQGRYSEIDTRR
jgi:hypothetical protein